MAFKFPFTNYHELNLTWVLDQLKSLFEQSEENVTTIETYENRLTAVETELPGISETASEASRAAAAAGTLAQTATQKADTAQENAVQAQGLAGTARQEAQAAQTAANQATQAAQQAQATAQNFDGRITQAENDASQALEASRSFENRVQSAITTANNANQTATNAQGIAMRADQNAGAALDKIGDLSQLTTTAKQNLVVAINEAAQSGGGGDSSNCAPVIINTASGSSASFPDGANNRPIEKLVVNIEPYQSGTGEPSPDNVRHISGWDSAEIEQTGVNIWDEEWDRGYVDIADGGKFKDHPQHIRSKYKFLIDGGKTYYVVCNRAGTLGNIGIAFYTGNGDFISGDVIPVNSIFTSPPTTKMMAFFVPTSWYTGDYANDISINYPATDTQYHHNTGEKIYVTFPTAVYGGSYEVISGQLLSNMFSFKAAPNFVYSMASSTDTVQVFYLNFADNNLPTGFPALPDCISSHFSENIPSNTQGRMTVNNNGIYFVLNKTTADSLETLRTWLSSNDIWFYYSINPTEYQMTPQEIKTLYGRNTILSNVGSIGEVQYPADTKLYIDNKFAELQALILEH